MPGKKKKKKRQKMDADVFDGKAFEEMTPDEVEYTKMLPVFFHPKPEEEVLMKKFMVKLPGGRQKKYEMDIKSATVFNLREKL